MKTCAKPPGIVANFSARPGSVIQYDEANVVALVDLALAVPTRRGDYPGRCSRAIQQRFAAAICRIEGSRVNPAGITVAALMHAMPGGDQDRGSNQRRSAAVGSIVCRREQEPARKPVGRLGLRILADQIVRVVIDRL